MKIVIIGGVGGGATAAARARRLSEEAEIIVFERGAHVSFANCGLPYHIGRSIPDRQSLFVQTKEDLTERFRLDIRTKTEVLRIDRASKHVLARRLETGAEYTESYDYLILSPGAAPYVPNLPGVNDPRIYTLRNMADMDRINEAIDAGVKRAVVVGGGFIGLEMVENLRRRDISVSVVELQAQVMPPLDVEIAAAVQKELERNEVEVYLGATIEAFERSDQLTEVRLQDQTRLPADLVILSVGVRPDSLLSREAGLEMSERGAIIVDARMRTSDTAIYAIGDAVEVPDPVLGGSVFIPLAGPANRQARIAVDNIFGRDARYRGTQGTSIVEVFHITAAQTGASEKRLKALNIPFKKIYVHRPQHAGYFPGARSMMIKLLFTADSGRILGAQIVGAEGVDKRIDVLATALHAGLTVFDLQNLELAYSPQYGAAKDPVNIAAYAAANVLQDDEQYVYAEDLDQKRKDGGYLIDVREPVEFEAGHISGAVSLPLSQLRARLRELPSDRELLVCCAIGQRGYYATRILRAHGFKAVNLAGGYATWNLFNVPGKQVEKIAPTASAAAGECCKIPGGQLPACTLQLTGLPCPGPLAKLSEAADKLPEGSVLEAILDATAASDTAAWAKAKGHAVLSRTEDSSGVRIKLQIGGAANGVQEKQRMQEKNKTIVVFSGDLDRVLAAFVLANAAADMGSSVTLFFTFWALNALRKEDGAAVQKPLLDKMFGWMMPRGPRKLPLSKMHFGGAGTAMMKHVMKTKNVDSLEQLMESALQKGVKLVACSMSMNVMGLKPEELLDKIEIGGAAAYLSAAEESGVNLFI